MTNDTGANEGVIESVRIPAARSEPDLDNTQAQDDPQDDDEPEADALEPDDEQPIAAVCDNEIIDVHLDRAEVGLSLDDDPDTSVVIWTQLHLMSEHQIPAALQMSDTDAERVHQTMHQVGPVDHSIADERFRPGRAVAGMLLAIQRDHELQLAETVEPEPVIG